MNLWILGRGSSGNAVLVQTERSRILIDAGFARMLVPRRLGGAELGIDAWFEVMLEIGRAEKGAEGQSDDALSLGQIALGQRADDNHRPTPVLLRRGDAIPRPAAHATGPARRGLALRGQPEPSRHPL